MCRLCEQKPVYEFTNKRKVCKTCYIHWFEKKFLYAIRKFKMIKKGEDIVIENSDDINSKVHKNLMEDYAKRGTIKIVKDKKNSHMLFSNTIDDFAVRIIDTILKRNEKDLLKIKKESRPLFLFLEKEVVLYAKLKGIKGKEINKKTKINILLNDLEKNHPEVKNAVVKSYIKCY